MEMTVEEKKPHHEGDRTGLKERSPSVPFIIVHENDFTAVSAEKKPEIPVPPKFWAESDVISAVSSVFSH